MSDALDRLAGHLAVQLGLAAPDDVDGARARAARDRLPLAQALQLSDDDRAVLERSVARLVARHGDAVRATQALAEGLQAVTQSFGGFADTHISDEVPQVDSLESLTVVVAEMPGRYLRDDGPELGRGGMGRVVSVRDQVLGRHVALKELLPSSAAADSRTSGVAEARFLREARLAGQLEHPHIVPVYEVGRRVDGGLYYTMRRIEGRTLASALAQARDLPGRLRLLSHVLAAAQAVAYAHSRQVLHRDLKPHNVMLGHFGETWLLDWGLARIKGRSDPRAQELALAPDITGSLQLGAVGTPSYMSPEQARGLIDQLDERTDVWGLGAVLYELLTGRPPYVGTRPIDCVQHILTEDYPAPQSLAPDAPEDLLAVCTKALARRPEDRYPTAAAFAQDLQRWIEGRTVSAREYRTLELLGRSLKRYPRTTALVSSLLVALAGVIGWSTLRIDQERNEARTLSRFVLNEVTTELASLPGAEELVQKVLEPALAFYLHDGRALRDDERPLVARSLVYRGRVHLTAGRLDEAARDIAECERVLPSDSPLASASPDAAGSAAYCEILRFDLAQLRGDEPALEALAAQFRAFLARPTPQGTPTVRWYSARSIVLGRLGSFLSQRQKLPEARGLLEQAIAADEGALALAPENPDARAMLVGSLRELSLSVFDPRNPEQSLALGQRSLDTARGTPRRFQNVKVLRTWTASLQQQAMLLKWTDRASEATDLASEGQRVFEQLLALEPDDVTSLGVYADFLLELGRPAEALAYLKKTGERGVRGDYLTSSVLAALAAGKLDDLFGLADAVAQSTDPETHWLYGLALAERGRFAEAAHEVRAYTEEPDRVSVQWPRGVLARLQAKRAGPADVVLSDYVDAMEDAIATAGVAQYLEVTRRLADRLEQLARQHPADGGTAR